MVAVEGHVLCMLDSPKRKLDLMEAVVGEGTLDRATYRLRFEEHCPDGYVQITHLPAEKIPQARAALYQTGADAGVRWKGGATAITG